jgi:hypothetical protein
MCGYSEGLLKAVPLLAWVVPSSYLGRDIGQLDFGEETNVEILPHYTIVIAYDIFTNILPSGER